MNFRQMLKSKSMERRRYPMRSVARKLDPWRVKAMRSRRADGAKISEIAAEFGVSDPTAYKVCERIT